MSFFNNSSPSVSTIGPGTKSANLDNDQSNIQNNNRYSNQYNNDNNFQNNNNNNIQNNNDNILPTSDGNGIQNNIDNGIQSNNDDNFQYRNGNNNNLQSGSLPKIKYSLPSSSINQPKQEMSPGLIAVMVIVPLVVVFIMLLICRQRFYSRTSKFDQRSLGQGEPCDEIATSRAIGLDIPDGETRSDRIRRMMLGGRNRRHSRSDSVSTVPEYSLNPIASEMTISSSELHSNSTVQTSFFSRFINGLHNQSSAPTPPPPDYEINSSPSEPRNQLSRTATNSSSTGSTSTSNSSIFTFSSSTHSPKSTTRSNTVDNLPSLDQQSMRTGQRNGDAQIPHHSNLSQLQVHSSRTQLPSIRPLDQISPLTSFISLNNTPFSPSPPLTGQSNPNHSTISIH
ncbi:uncharacterized protein MELLADRAFT_107733 [Melampsora larici-populina 98AG31]|uniref:Uncharacterized protein n=1 Tax=Melampsora larici-populina (strain 98AG31 / pathotype 3-4-7) TaxID=747676 RepID=F4RQS2_MELLP|nr:uncharacterized protein MELLADRAFT_107733 [Melampsora larici-populina 98AG31]EGG05273.1 hypothetical protein MELLADRAFT_107733 [Melampsora larici-populina 98AG31]